MKSRPLYLNASLSSQYKMRVSSKGIPTVKITQSWDHFVCKIGIPTNEKTIITLKRPPIFEFQLCRSCAAQIKHFVFPVSSQSHDRLIFTMGISIHGRTTLLLNRSLYFPFSDVSTCSALIRTQYRMSIYGRWHARPIPSPCVWWGRWVHCHAWGVMAVRGRTQH